MIVLQHQIFNLYCQPVTLIKVNVEGISQFFDETIKVKNKTLSKSWECNKNLLHYHNHENVFEIYDELKPFESQLLNASNFIYQEVLNYDNELKITNAWFNECEIGGNQEFHNHCNSMLSGTVYLRVDDNTHIQFLNRHMTSETTNQLFDTPNYKKQNKYGYYYHQETATFNVQEGDCLIWPSYLTHGYFNNQTPNRLSLSFNLLPKTLTCLYKM